MKFFLKSGTLIDSHHQPMIITKVIAQSEYTDEYPSIYITQQTVAWNDNFFQWKYILYCNYLCNTTSWS